MQAWRQSSVTGRGSRKNIWGAQINFTLSFGREEQKKKGKKSSSWPFTFIWSTILAWGGTLLPSGARRNLMVRISLLAQKFRDEDQKSKKRSSARNLGLSSGVHSCFSSWNKILLTLGGHRPRNALQWHRACYFFSGHNPCMGGTLFAWGSQAVILGVTTPKCLPVAPSLFQ